MKDIFEMISMMAGGGLQCTLGSLEMDYMTVMEYTQLTIIIMKGSFKKHSRVGKEFASKDRK